MGSSIDELMKNDIEVFSSAIHLLTRISGNILKEPSNPKFRSISLKSAQFYDKLMPAEGALNCLFEMGFQEGTDSLILPVEAPLEPVKRMHDALFKKKELISSPPKTASASSSPSASKELHSSPQETASATPSPSTTTELLSSPSRTAPTPSLSTTQELSPQKQTVERNSPSTSKQFRRTATSTTTPEGSTPRSTSPCASKESLSTPDITSQSSSKGVPSGSPVKVIKPTPIATTVSPSSTGPALIAFDLLTLGQHIHNDFLRKIYHSSIDVLRYENFKLQREALEYIPITRLAVSAERARRSIQEAYKRNEVVEDIESVQGLLLNALINWFKYEFFSWVDKPPCPSCNSTETVCRRIDEVNHSSANRIEVYECLKCQAEVLFPRYNDPGVLLRTRRGRCGEWAKCFYLMCRSMGWDARIVFDETDHAWVEVFLAIPGKWVHCDPCEGIMDAPLVYEHGWGKKLTYVIAHSVEGPQDVTWRYSSNHRQVLARRKLVKEDDLVRLILEIRDIQLEGLSSSRRYYVLKRIAVELADMLLERTVSKSELKGRISGGLQWRISRGEVKAHTWKFSKNDVRGGRVIVGYSPARDVYVTGETRTEALKGWEAGVFEAKHIQLKEEKDWKMAYLCRCEDWDTSKIVWQFELEEGLTLGAIDLIFKTAVFHSGIVDVIVCSGESCFKMPKGSDRVKSEAFAGKRNLMLTANLTGGDGDNAWQHSQLFRQPLDEKDQFPFLLTLFVNIN